MILLAIVAVMGLIELTVGREDYGSSEAEPGKLGDEFWQAARPADPQVGAGCLFLRGGVHSTLYYCCVYASLPPVCLFCARRRVHASDC